MAKGFTSNIAAFLLYCHVGLVNKRAAKRPKDLLDSNFRECRSYELSMVLQMPKFTLNTTRLLLPGL